MFVFLPIPRAAELASLELRCPDQQVPTGDIVRTLPLVVGIAILLCSCGTTSQVQTSLNHSGQAMTGMDLTSPQFYMDDDRPPSDFYARSQLHSVDNFCSANCQSRGGSGGYCNRACGF